MSERVPEKAEIAPEHVSPKPSRSGSDVASDSRLFGTDGIRKLVGSEITPNFIAAVISAYATWVDGSGPVLVAHDYRTTSDGLARLCAGTLQLNGVDVYELGTMPTPCLQFNVPALGARAGLMITASHNPTDFNGIKFCGADGLEIPPEAEHTIEKAFHQGLHRHSTWDRAGKIRSETRGIERYLASIVTNVDREAIRRHHLKVVLDCGNGTSAATSPTLLRTLGTELTTLNANPDGGFPGHPSEPTEENLRNLRSAVVEFNAELGVAHDGDSDRIAFVDEGGRYVPGEVTLALLAREVLREQPKATIVTSVTSSTAISDVVREEGGALVVTRSGSLAVALGVARSGAAFGGEENGHYYWPRHQNAPDGPMSSAKLLELLARTREPLSEMVDKIPKYHLVKIRVPLPPTVKDAVLRQVAVTLSSEATRIETIDGVKAFYEEGWVLIRPSGTEPICRIFAESRDPAHAESLSNRGKRLVSDLVSSASGT